MKTTRNLASVYVVVITAVIVLLSSGRLASSNASSTDYAVADSFDYPISGYDVTGFKFGKVGTYPDGTDKYHLGEDVLAPEGTEIKAMANGFVKYVKTYDSCAANSAFGTVVVVEHRLLSGDSAGNNAYSKYEHLRARDIKVTANTEIKKGDTI